MSADGRDSGTLPSRQSDQATAAPGDLHGARRRAIGQVVSVLVCVAAITAYVQLGSSQKARESRSVVSELGSVAKSARPEEPKKPVHVAIALPAPVAAPVEPPAPPQIDRAAVAQAEAALDAASRDRRGPTIEPRMRLAG